MKRSNYEISNDKLFLIPRPQRERSRISRQHDAPGHQSEPRDEAEAARLENRDCARLRRRRGLGWGWGWRWRRVTVAGRRQHQLRHGLLVLILHRVNGRVGAVDGAADLPHLVQARRIRRNLRYSDDIDII